MIRALLVTVAMAVIAMIAAALVVVDLVVKIWPLLVAAVIIRRCWVHRRRHRPFGPPPPLHTLAAPPAGVVWLPDVTALDAPAAAAVPWTPTRAIGTATRWEGRRG